MSGKWILISAMALWPTVPAAAQTDLPPEVLDGMYITVAEIRSNSMDTFQTFAGPDGGPIAKDEFVATPLPSSLLPNKSEEELMTRLFSLLDANSDGKLTLGEWRDRLDKDLQFADQNDDGRITLRELSNAKQNLGFGEALGLVF